MTTEFILGKISPDIIDKIPTGIQYALLSLDHGIALPSMLWEYNLMHLDPVHSVVNRNGDEIKLEGYGGGTALLIRSRDHIINEVQITMGNYKRGINIPWKYFTERYQHTDFEQFIHSLPIPHADDTTEPIGFTYKQWRDENGQDRACIILAESVHPKFETEPFFEFQA